jgi:hypothetical protein
MALVCTLLVDQGDKLHIDPCSRLESMAHTGEDVLQTPKEQIFIITFTSEGDYKFVIGGEP